MSTKPVTLYLTPALEARLADLRAAGVPLRSSSPKALADLTRLGMVANGVLPPEIERALDPDTSVNVVHALSQLAQLALRRTEILAQLREVENQQQAIFLQLKPAAAALAEDCTALAQAGRIFCAQAKLATSPPRHDALPAVSVLPSDAVGE